MESDCMARPSETQESLPTDAWQRLEGIIRRFEDAWRQETPPAIDDYLPHEGPERDTALRELVHTDLEGRFAKGQAVRVEMYFERYAELKADATAALDLIVAEYRQRQARGEQAQLGEYLDRFPELRDHLSVRLQEPAPQPRESNRHIADAPGLQATEAACARPTADRNLLFGILALQMDFIGRDALIAAMHTWVLDKAKALGQILREQGALSGERHVLLDALVQEHLKQHSNDPEKSLAAVSSVGSVRDDLERITDPDLQASLAAVTSAGTSHDDGDATSEFVSTTASTPSAPRFRVLRLHARGGLGEVFVARDEQLHREVALKQIQARHADRPESRTRFLLEAEITARLEHPGVVPVYGLGQYADGRPFYAMRFVKGDSLKDAAEHFHGTDAGERALEFRSLLGRFVDVCNAVAYAHSRGVLHRDLKPGNILLGPYGETLVVDWGLAKVVGRPQRPSTSSEDTLRPDAVDAATPTEMGRAVGTPQFMSPEQAAGELDRLGPATDVYSLGATLYSLLTGKAPFFDADSDAILLRVERGDFLPPHQVKPGVPRALEAICVKAMALRSEERYSSVRAMADDIEHWLAGEPVRAYPEPWRVKIRRWLGRHRTLVTATAATVLMALVLLSVTTLLLTAANRLLVTANAEKEQARRDAEANARVAEASRREAQMRSAEMAVQRALVETDSSRAMLWFARALELAPEDAEAARLRRAIRINLGASRPRYRIRSVWAGPDGFRPDGAALTPDGGSILVAGHDEATGLGTARLWNVASGEPVGSPVGSEEPISCAVPSADCKTVLMGSTTGLVRQWDMATAKLTGASYKHGGPVHAIAVSPDGKAVLSGGDDGQACLWERASGKAWLSLRHKRPVRAVGFSRDGRLLVTAGDDGAARLWQAETGRNVVTVSSHDEQPLLAVGFSPDGNHLATAAKLGRVCLWEAATGKLLHAISAHADQAQGVAFSADGKILVTAGSDHTTRFWDAATGQPIGAPLQHPDEVLSATLSSDGRFLLSRTWWDVRVWEVAPVRPVLRADHCVTSVAYSPDGRTILTGCANLSPLAFLPWSKRGEVRLWDATTGNPLTAPVPQKEMVVSVAFSPDGRHFLTGSFRLDEGAGEVQLWETATMQRVGPQIELAHGALAVAYNPDGRSFAAGGMDGMVRIWDAATGKLLRIFKHANWVAFLLFRADGRALLTGCRDDYARIWDLTTDPPVIQKLNNGSIVAGAAFSPDGRTLLTGGGDRTARQWDLRTGKPIGKAFQHDNWIRPVAYSPDGRLALTGSGDTTARVWDVETGRPIGAPLRHSDWVLAAVFSPDGKTIATGSKDGTARFWDAPVPMEGETQRLVLWTQLETGLEMDADGGIHAIKAAAWLQRRQQLQALGGPPAP
jgi:WD40 repeat protein/tRNA A-37 threonylcarbamoyl transferase component Bud32